MSDRILDFVTSLATNTKAQDEFSKNPLKYMQDHNLSASEADAISRGDVAEIRKIAGQNLDEKGIHILVCIVNES